MNYKPLGTPVLQYFNVTTEQILVPSSGAKLEFLVAGDITTKNVYTWDGVGFVSLGNEIILDSEGYANETGVWMEEGFYKINLYLSDGAGGFEVSPKWSVDNFEGAASSTSGYSTGIVYTIEELRNLGPAEYDFVNVLGYYASGDGGGGLFEWSSSSTAADDNGMFIEVLTGGPTGRYIRRPIGTEMFEAWYGIMDRGNSYPMATRFNQMVAYVSTAQSFTKTIRCSSVNHWFMGTCDIGIDAGIEIIMPEGFTIEGTAGNPSTLRIFSGNTAQVLTKSKITSEAEYGFFKPQPALTDIRPEWWGAAGDGVTDDSLPIKNAVEYGSGTNRLIISGYYAMPGNHGEMNATNPVIVYKEIEDSGITFTGNSVIYIRGFEGMQGLCLSGASNVEFSGLPRKRLELSRVGPFNRTTLNALSVSAASYGGDWIFVWDGVTFTITLDFTDPATNVYHEIMAGSGITILGNDVTLNNVSAPDTEWISSTGGVMTLPNVSEVKASWFGGATQNAVNCAESSGKLLDGGSISTIVSDLSFGSISNFSGRNCVWSGNALFNNNAVILDSCTINSGSRSSSALVCDSALDYLIMDNCSVVGTGQYMAREMSVRSCSINAESIDIYSSPTSYKSSVFFNTRFIDCNVNLRNSGTLMRDILVDTCIWVTSIASSPSQLTLVSDAASVEVRGVRVLNPCEEFITGASRADAIFATTAVEGAGSFSTDNSNHVLVIDKLNSANSGNGRQCRRTHGHGEFVLKGTSGVPYMEALTNDWFSLPGVTDNWYYVMGGTAQYFNGSSWILATIYPSYRELSGTDSAFVCEYEEQRGSVTDNTLIAVCYGERFRMNGNG